MRWARDRPGGAATAAYFRIGSDPTDNRRQVGRIVSIGVVLACALMALAWLLTPEPPPGADGPLSFAEVFQRPTNRAEVMINRRDGPAFAQLATDLTLDDPAGFHDYFAGSEPEEELAYRAGRPLMAWLTWVLSFGAHRSLLAPALMALTIGGLGAVVAATALMAVRLGRDPTWAWTAVVLPGLGVSLWAPGGCEPLAVALALFGWILWKPERRTWAPILLWCLAALARETSLIVPVALALAPGTPVRRRIEAICIPAGVYLAWLLVIHWRTGLFPGNAGGGRVSPFFGGFAEGSAHWDAADWSVLLMIVAFGVLAWRLPLAAARWIVLAHAVLASTFGHLVWEQAIDFTRIFALVEVLGLLALLPRASRTAPRQLLEAR